MPEAIDLRSLFILTSMCWPLINADFDGDDHNDKLITKPRRDRKGRKQPKSVYFAKRNPTITKRRDYH